MKHVNHESFQWIWGPSSIQLAFGHSVVMTGFIQYMIV